MKDLSLVYTGSDFESDIIKSQLESVGIPSLLKSENQAAASAGFGASGFCRVYVNPEDLTAAEKIVKEFEARKEES